MTKIHSLPQGLNRALRQLASDGGGFLNLGGQVCGGSPRSPILAHTVDWLRLVSYGYVAGGLDEASGEYRLYVTAEGDALLRRAVARSAA